MSSNPQAYRGGEPYTFVCYAHADSDAVYPLIHALQQAGHNIWYDEGISPGSSWTEELAKAIEGCRHFLLFVSPRSVASGHCLDEINFAMEHKVNVVAAHLEETEVPAGLRLSLNRRQAIFRAKLGDEVFVEKIDEALQRTGDSAATTSNAAAKRSIRWPITLGILAALIFIGVGTAWWMTDPLVERDPSVLLLPFDDPGLDQDLGYLPASLNSDLISRLSRMPKLKVIAPLSAQKFAQSGRSLEEMAAATGVAHVLTGTIQSAGGTVRVSANLVRVEDASVVWSDQFEGTIFEGKIDGLFELQSSFANSIATALSLRLDDELLASMQDSGTSSIEAFDLALRNMKVAKRGDTSSSAEIIGNAKRIVELDPEFVDGWASLAILTEINRFINAQAGDALEYAETAYRLDPTNARALRAMGFVRMTSDPELALQYLDKAVAAMPQNALMHTDKGIALKALRRFEEARGVLEHAVELDPLNEFARGNLVEVLMAMGLMQEARSQAELGVELQPNNPHARLFLARVLANPLEPFESLVETVRAVEGNPMFRAEAGLILQLIQHDQLAAATAWQSFFVERSPNVMMTGMAARIAKSAGNLAGYELWLASLPAETDKGLLLTLHAMRAMMQANVTSEAEKRLLLQQQAFAGYQQRETLKPIPAQPASDLALFAALTRLFEPASDASKLLERFRSTPNAPIYATERALQAILSDDEEQALTTIEKLAQNGSLNVPLLRELGMFGENQPLFGAMVKNPRFEQAVAQQQSINENLNLRAATEFPKLLDPKR